MKERIEPGTHEEDIYRRLLPAVSRAGLPVDAAACERLALVIQQQGHKSQAAKRMAREMGLHAKYLPRRRA